MTVVETPSIIATGWAGIGILGSNCSCGCTAIRDLCRVSFIGTFFRNNPSPGRLLMYPFLGPGSIIRPVMHNRPPRPKTPLISTITALSVRRDHEATSHVPTINRTLTLSLHKSHYSPRIRPSFSGNDLEPGSCGGPPGSRYIRFRSSYLDRYSESFTISHVQFSILSHFLHSMLFLLDDSPLDSLCFYPENIHSNCYGNLIIVNLNIKKICHCDSEQKLWWIGPYFKNW